MWLNNDKMLCAKLSKYIIFVLSNNLTKDKTNKNKKESKSEKAEILVDQVNIKVSNLKEI